WSRSRVAFKSWHKSLARSLAWTSSGASGSYSSPATIFSFSVRMGPPAPSGSSTSRQPKLDPVLRRYRQQPLNLLLRRRHSGRGTFRQRNAKLEEHLLQASRRTRNQHLGRLAAFILA